MSTVLYLGDERFAPTFSEEKVANGRYSKVNFKIKELIELVKDIDFLKDTDYEEFMMLIDCDNPRFVKAECSETNTYLIDSKNELWIFGTSMLGELGVGKTVERIKIPINLGRLYIDLKFSKVAPGDSHVIALEEKGGLYSWGDTVFGATGKMETKKIFKAPKAFHSSLLLKAIQEYELQFDEFWNEYIESIEVQGISCSDHVSLVLANEMVFSFGKERAGRLGKGPHLKYLPQPHVVDFPNRPKIKGISCGRLHCIAWDSNGMLYSWGDGADGKLGHPTDKGGFDYFQNYPQYIKALEGHKFIQATCGYYHSCGLTTKGEIYTWGRMQYENWEAREKIWVEKTYDPNLLNFMNGRTYIQGEKQKMLKLDALRPKKLTGHKAKGQLGMELFDSFFVKISSRARQNVAIDNKGRIYAWGSNKNNCLGINNFNAINNPLLIDGLSDYKVVDASCGNGFTVLILLDVYDKKDPFGLLSFKETQFSNIREKINKIKVSRNEISRNQISMLEKNMSVTKSQQLLTGIANKNDISEMGKSLMMHQRSQTKLTEDKSVLKDVLVEYGLNESTVQQMTPKIGKKDGKVRPKTAMSLGGNEVGPRFEQKSHFRENLDEKLKADTDTKASNQLLVFDNVSNFVAEKEVPNKMKQKSHQKYDDNITIAMNISDLDHFDRESLFQKQTGGKNKMELNNYYNSEKIQRFMKKRNKSAQCFMDPNRYPKKLRGEDLKHDSTILLNKTKNISMDINNIKFTSFKIAQTNITTASAPVTTENFLNISKYFNNEYKISPKEKQLNKIRENSGKRDNRIQSANYKKKVELLKKKKKTYDAFIRKNKDAPTIYKLEAERLGIYKASGSLPLNWALNWFLFMNMEKLIYFIHYLCDEGMKLKREKFHLIHAIKVIQRRYRYFMMEKRMRYLTPENIRKLRNSFLKNVIQRRIAKKCRAAKLIISAHIVRKLKRNLGTKLYLVYRSSCHIQSFFSWSLRSSKIYKNYIQEIWDSHLLNISRIKDHSIPLDLIPDHINKEVRDRRRGGIEAGGLNKPIIRFSTYIKLVKDEIEKNRDTRAIEIGSKQVDEDAIFDGILEDAGTTKFEFLLEKLVSISKIRKLDSFSEKVDVQEGIIKKQKDKVIFQQQNKEDQLPKKGLVIRKSSQSRMDTPMEKQNTQLSLTMGRNPSANNYDDQLESLLPFTKHNSEIAIPLNLLLKYDSNQTAHEAVFKDLMDYEEQLKNNFISKLYTYLLRKHRDSLRDFYELFLFAKYANKLDNFILDNREKINIQRTKLMLRTPLDKLKLICEKEDLEYKLAMNNKKNPKFAKNKDFFERDHLPFAHLKKKLALALPNAPKRPTFILSISSENFKKLFEEYSELIHSKYSMLIQSEKKKMFDKKKRSLKKNQQQL